MTVSQENQVPPLLQDVTLRLGSVHPFVSSLWSKWAKNESTEEAGGGESEGEEDVDIETRAAEGMCHMLPVNNLYLLGIFLILI